MCVEHSKIVCEQNKFDLLKSHLSSQLIFKLLSPAAALSILLLRVDYRNKDIIEIVETVVALANI